MSKKTLGSLGPLLPSPAAVATLGAGHGKPWSSDAPRPQLPPHLASSPLGLSFPSVMRQWGPSTQAASPHPQESAWKFLGLEVRGKGRGGQEEKKVQVGSPRPGGGLTLSL